MEEESSSVPFLHRLPSIPAVAVSAAFPSSSTHAFPIPTMRFCGWASACGVWFRAFLRNYDTLQAAAIFLLYIQIGCAMVGSIGAVYNGVLVIDLVVALFALVAIESNSQSLGRTYAVLLLCVILLDVLWFTLFSHDIWSKSSSQYGTSVVFSVRLALSMEIVGFSTRLLSSFLWIQMYRLGASVVDSTADMDLRNSFLNPEIQSPAITRENFFSGGILHGYLYDASDYSNNFQDALDNEYAYRLNKQHQSDGEGSESSSESSQFKTCLSRSFQVFNDDCTPNNQHF